MRVAWFLLTVPMLAACGASSATNTSTITTTTVTSAPRLSQKTFVTDGNLVCLHSDRRVYKLGTLSKDPTGWAKIADAARTALAEMGRLRPPIDDQVRFDHLLALGRRLETGIAEVHAALVRHDVTAAQRDQSAARTVSAEIHTQAHRLGLTFCQQALTNWPA